MQKKNGWRGGPMMALAVTLGCLWCMAMPVRAENPMTAMPKYYGKKVNYHKYMRQHNGGWVNLGLGVEGGAGWSGAWQTGATVGMRIGNYRDVVQLEVGLAPGVRGKDTFHMPVYSSLKISRRSGRLYLKVGGAYNHIIRHDEEGAWSARIGVGSAWKHWEWDWAWANMESTDGNCSWSGRSPLTFGMRLAWYLTR